MSTPSDTAFGMRLRQERERRRITLATIAGDTKISISLLQALERGDISRWPGGIFRRCFIRDYANAAGLNVDEVSREFFDRFPDPAAPPEPPARGAGASEPCRRRWAEAWDAIASRFVQRRVERRSYVSMDSAHRAARHLGVDY